MRLTDGWHDHRGRHRYRSRLSARQHRRDRRFCRGRIHGRMVHRSAARAPPRTARRRMSYRGAVTRWPAARITAAPRCMIPSHRRSASVQPRDSSILPKERSEFQRRITMIRLIAAAGFAVAVAASAQAITPAPLTQPDAMFTQVRFGLRPCQDPTCWCLCS